MTTRNYTLKVLSPVRKTTDLAADGTSQEKMYVRLQTAADAARQPQDGVAIGAGIVIPLTVTDPARFGEFVPGGTVNVSLSL